MITSAFKNYLWNFQKILIQKAQLRRAATYEVFLTHFWSVVVATQTKARPVVYKQQRQKFFLLQIQLLLTSIILWLQNFFHSSDSTSTRWRCGPAPSRKSNGAGTRPRPRSKPSPSRGRGGRKVGGRRAEKAAERHKWQVGSIPLTGNFTPSYFSLKCGFRSVSHSCELEELNWQFFAPFLLMLRRSAVTAVFISLKSVPHWVTWCVECVWWRFYKIKAIIFDIFGMNSLNFYEWFYLSVLVVKFLMHYIDNDHFILKDSMLFVWL